MVFDYTAEIETVEIEECLYKKLALRFGKKIKEPVVRILDLRNRITF
jgi:hypothetical protein